MYRTNKVQGTSISLNNSSEGESIEQKMERVVNNNEPIKDGAPIVYTERREGVQPGYNIRTDRFEVAIDAMDKVSGTHRAKREERQKTVIEEYNKKQKGENSAEPKSTQGTSE